MAFTLFGRARKRRPPGCASRGWRASSARNGLGPDEIAEWPGERNEAGPRRRGKSTTYTAKAKI